MADARLHVRQHPPIRWLAANGKVPHVYRHINRTLVTISAFNTGCGQTGQLTIVTKEEFVFSYSEHRYWLVGRRPLAYSAYVLVLWDSDTVEAVVPLNNKNTVTNQQNVLDDIHDLESSRYQNADLRLQKE